FRTWLDAQGVTDAALTAPPPASAGLDWLPRLALPADAQGALEFDHSRVRAVHVVRQDEGEATRLYVTVATRSLRGEGLASPQLDRAMQMVYTVEPAPFEGFDYGILANNVDCVFCHTVVDS